MSLHKRKGMALSNLPEGISNIVAARYATEIRSSSNIVATRYATEIRSSSNVCRYSIYDVLRII